MRTAACVVSVLAFLAGTAWAQDLPDKRPTGLAPPGAAGNRAIRGVNVLAIESDLQVGRPMPDFELEGTRGQVVRRADLRGRWAVLVFDEARQRFAALDAVRDSLDRRGVRLYGVSPDAWRVLRDFSRRRGLSSELLSDPTRQVSKLFDMFDPASGTIRPGVVLVDPAGIVLRVLDDQSPGAREILELVERAVPGIEPTAAGRPD